MLLLPIVGNYNIRHWSHRQLRNVIARFCEHGPLVHKLEGGICRHVETTSQFRKGDFHFKNGQQAVKDHYAKKRYATELLA